MGLDSVLRIARSLHVLEEDIPVLRSETLRWLEDAYRDDRIVAKLHANEISRQARDFVRAHGSKFFQIAIEDKIITGLNDKRLAYRVAKMMGCQVKYKTRTVDARSRRSGVRPNTEQDNCETESTSGTSQGSQDDQEYQPSVKLARFPLEKLHNTRLNAQPGMPIRCSIEVNKSFIASTHLTGRPNKKKYANVSARAGSDAERDGISPSPERSAFTPSRCVQHKQRTSRELRDYTTPPPLEKILNWKDVSHDPIEQNKRESKEREIVPQQNALLQASEPASNNPEETETGIIANSTRIEPDLLDVNFDRFLSSHDAQAMNAAGITTDDWRSSPAPILNKTPRCQHTPPGSGRAELISNLNLSGRHNERDEHFTRERAEKIVHTAQPGCRIYLGGDHFKVIDRDRADQALQSVFNVLNDFSRDCQIRCRDKTASYAQQKLEEHIADSICQLLRQLRNSTQIWKDVEIAQTKIELL